MPSQRVGTSGVIEAWSTAEKRTAHERAPRLRAMRRTWAVACFVAVVVGACAEDVGDGEATGTTDADSGTAGGGSSTGAGSEGSSSSSGADTQGATTGTGETVGFGDLSPIFNHKCGPCHVTASFGGHNLGSADPAVGFADSQLPANSAACDGLTKGACSRVRVQSGSMPMGLGCTGDPGTDAANQSCLTEREQELLAAWIEGGQAGP